MVKSLLSAMVALALLAIGTATTLANDTSGVDSALHSDLDSGLDFSEPPFVIFAPAPPLPEAISDYPLPDGAEDFWDLWEADAPWGEAAAHIDAFALHAWMVRYSSADEDLRRMLAWLADHDIPLGLEVEPLTWPGPHVCDHTEGFEGPYDLEVAQHIRDLGGKVAFISLDEPYAHAHKMTGPGACGYPVEQVVDEVAEFVRRFRLIHPDVQVGSIEPVVSGPSLTPRDAEIWLDTWEERTGEPFAFLNIDVDWRIADWPERVRQVEAVADGRGVPFGMLYLGSEFEDTNEGWLQQLADHFATFEQEHGGTPDLVGLYSWHSRPDRLLPDDDIDSFTGRINQYFGTRTALDEPSATGKAMTGTLTTADGAPLPGGVIRAEVTPLFTTSQRHALAGTVPTGARRALIAVRANVEGGDPSSVDVRILDVSYREGKKGRNLVPNPRFARDLESWGAYGKGSVTAVPGEDRQAMRVRAKPREGIYVDGAEFKVTPGAPFRFSATLEVPPKSFGSGYISVIFVGTDTEYGRQGLWFQPRPLELPSVTTDETGAYRLPIRGLTAGRYDINIEHPGDIDHWPAHARARLKVD